MPLKLYHGINSGATLRTASPDSTWDFPTTPRGRNEGAFTVNSSDLRQTKVRLNGCDFHVELCYSTGKKKRWLLAEVLRAQLEDPDDPAEFGEQRVELVEGRRFNGIKFGAAAQSITLRVPEPQDQLPAVAMVRQLRPRNRRGFINRRSLTFRQPGQLAVDFLCAAAPPELRLTRRQTRINLKPHLPKGKPHGRRRYVTTAFEINEALNVDAIAEEEEVEVEEEAVMAARGAQLGDCLVVHRSAGVRRRRPPKVEPQLRSCKDRQVFEPASQTKSEAAEEKEDVRLLDDPITLVPRRMTFTSEALLAARLRAAFGDSYAEGDSEPRRFAIRLPTEDAAFLIFEERAKGDELTHCDVFLNADLDGDDRIDLDFPTTDIDIPTSDLDFPVSEFDKFIAACSRYVTERFAGRFTIREATTVVSFAKPPQPLSLTRPQVLEYPSLPWPPEPQQEEEEEEEESEDKEDACAICLEDLTPACRLLRCRHAFCTACWRRYVVASLRQARPALRCPAANCRQHLGAVTTLRFASLSLLTPHWRSLEMIRVAEDPLLAACPSRRCDRVVRVALPPAFGQALNVTCLCGHVFCFNCREEAHWPVTCRMYRCFKVKQQQLGDWHIQDIIASDVLVEGQPCPACARFIEKNGGCPSMICICGANFCWQCARPMSEGNHNGCYRNHMFQRRPAEWRKVKLHSANITPAPSRSRRYCTALRWRLQRLHCLRQPQLNQHHVLSVLYEETPDPARLPILMTEAAAIMQVFKEVLRIVEFCLVAACVLRRRSHAAPRNALVQTARRLADLATSMREVAARTRNTTGQVRAEKLRWCLARAHTEVRFLQRLRVWDEPSAISAGLR